MCSGSEHDEELRTLHFRERLLARVLLGLGHDSRSTRSRPSNSLVSTAYHPRCLRRVLRLIPSQIESQLCNLRVLREPPEPRLPAYLLAKCHVHLPYPLRRRSPLLCLRPLYEIASHQDSSLTQAQLCKERRFRDNAG